MKHTYILVLSLSLLLGSCNNNKPINDTDHAVTTITSQSATGNVQDNSKDNYVGDWVDINHDPNDPNETEIFKITKLHDREYQIDTQTATLTISDKGAEYLSLWLEESGAEAQFIYDNYTDHLMMRTPFFSKELRKK